MSSIILSMLTAGIIPTAGLVSTPAPPDGGGGMGTLTDATAISVNLSSGFAPLNVTFWTDLSSADMQTHQIKWAFDDVGTYSLLDSTRLSGRDSNEAYGPVTSHTFEAGTYDVTCYIHDGTDWQTLTKTITVTDGDSYAPFSGTNTICVGSNYTGAPSGSQQTATTISGAVADLLTNNGGRILFRAGETFNFAAGTTSIAGSNLNGQTAVNEVSIGRFGTGADPILNIAVNGGNFILQKFDNVDTRIAFQNIEFIGDYNAALGTKPSGNRVVIHCNNDVTKAHILMDSCKVHKAERALTTQATFTPNLWVAFSNTEVTDWEDYGLGFVDSGNTSIIGCDVYQRLDAISGSENKQLGSSPNYPDHGPFRTSETYKFVCQKNDFLSRNGWSDAGGLGKAWQPMIRFDVGATLSDISIASVSQNQSEGGGTSHYTNNPSTGISRCAPAIAHVYEKNHMIGCTAAWTLVDISKGNSVYKNNIMVAPNVVQHANQIDKFFNVTPSNPHIGGNLTKPILIQGNAIIHLPSTGNQSRDSVIVKPADITSEGWTNLTYVNQGNIFHAPNRTSPTTVSNLNNTDVFTPLIDGSRWDTSTPSNPTPSGVGSTASYEPETGSSAIGAGTLGNVPVDDFNGNIRNTVLAGLTRTTPSEGPFEPNLES